MRITNNMMTSNLLYNVNKNLEYMSKRQDELATGKKIHRPSDDPVLASKILARRTDLAELEQYDKNTRDALGWLEVTEKALEDNGNVMQKIRELTVQAANGTNTAEDTQKIKTEVENMKAQLISNGNTTFAGRYIFSGFETDKKLMNEDGSFNIDVDQYSIDNKPKVKYEVSVGESIDVMTNGLDVYGTVLEPNIMSTNFPSGDYTGVASSKHQMLGDFDLTIDYSATANLDFDINGVTVNIPEGDLVGSPANPLSKSKVAEVYNTALGANGNAYFNGSGQFVIEAPSYGSANPITIASGVDYNPTITAGVDTSPAQATGIVVSHPLPMVPGDLTTEDIKALKENNLNIVINGVSKKIKPSPSAGFGTVAGYVSEMQNRIDAEFGPGVATITEAAPGQIQIDTVAAEDGVKPEITVDFPRTSTSELMADLDELMGYLDAGDTSGISSMLTKVDKHMNSMLSLRADIGARTNRMDMISKKIASNNVSFTQLLSDAQDADMSEVIMQLKNAENVYKASLSTGARVIQPSLVDFLR